MKKIIKVWSPKDMNFTCDDCNTQYSSNEYNTVVIPGNRNIPEQRRLHDKCPHCKSRVVMDPDDI